MKTMNIADMQIVNAGAKKRIATKQCRRCGRIFRQPYIFGWQRSIAFRVTAEQLKWHRVLYRHY